MTLTLSQSPTSIMETDHVLLSKHRLRFPHLTAVDLDSNRTHKNMFCDHD